MVASGVRSPATTTTTLPFSSVLCWALPARSGITREVQRTEDRFEPYATVMPSHTRASCCQSPHAVVDAIPVTAWSGGPETRGARGFSPALRPPFRQGVSSSNISIYFVLLRQAYGACHGVVRKRLVSKKVYDLSIRNWIGKSPTYRCGGESTPSAALFPAEFTI